ncbi:MAG: ABC transporter permease [bacterium]|nr:ABC transporter permease [bacterium]
MREKENEKRSRLFATQLMKQYSGLLLVIIVLFTVISVSNQNFCTVDNILAILRQISIYGVLGIGMGILIINKQLDLTVGAIAGLSAVVGGLVMIKGGGVFAAIIAAVAAGAILGAVNGIVVAKTGISAFIFTMAMTQVYRGMIYLITDGKPISPFPDLFLNVNRSSVLGIPIPVIILFIIVFIGWVILNKTSLGRKICATGGSEVAARYSGINTGRMTIASFIICGITAGISGVLLASKLQSAQPTLGTGLEMDAISVAAIGGISLDGGAGTIGGILLGAIIIGIINNGMIMMGINSYWQMIAKGLIIVFAVVFDIIKKKYSK